MSIISAGGVELASPVSISVNDEIIWSADTGRTLSGLMTGDVIAEKYNINIKWEFLQESELVIIKNKLIAGFFPLTFHDNGADMTIAAYRGTLSKELLGRLSDGIFWYRSVTVDIIQR